MILRTVHKTIQPCLFYNHTSWSHYKKPHYQYASYATGMTNDRKTNGLHRVFSGWRPFRIGAGIILVVAAYKWRQSYVKAGHELNAAKKWEVTCYRMIPLRASSRAWGWLTNIELPRPIRPLIYRCYSGMFGVDLEEARECDLTCFPTLADFFCRELKDGVRPIEPAPIVSPADGSVLNFGKVDSSHVDQVKGIKYSIPSFLGQPTWLQKDVVYGETIEADSEILLPGGTTDAEWEKYKKTLLHKPDSELYQCVVYLAPGDYHRFHSPVSWTVQFRRHFQGDLLSVNPKIARWIPDLFALNERAVYVGKWQHGFFAFVAVAATNVGNIRVHCDETLHTNLPKRRGQPMHIDRYLCPEKGGIPIAKGEHFGEFRLGSTIVLVFEAPKNFDFTLERGQKIKMGEALSWLQNRDGRHPVPPA